VPDPDVVEPIAEEVAQEYVVDEEEVITIVRQCAEEYTDAGNMYVNHPENHENPLERSDEYSEADAVADSLLAKASEYDIPEQEREHIDWSKYNTDEHLKDHGITAPDRRWFAR
jgi:flagellar motor switch protein FliG